MRSVQICQTTLNVAVKRTLSSGTAAPILHNALSMEPLFKQMEALSFKFLKGTLLLDETNEKTDDII